MDGWTMSLSLCRIETALPVGWPERFVQVIEVLDARIPHVVTEADIRDHPFEFHLVLQIDRPFERTGAVVVEIPRGAHAQIITHIDQVGVQLEDRKSTRLNSSHVA